MFQRDSYVPHRRLFYFLIWCIAVAVLALTAFRIHFTRKNFGTHDPIIAFLLVTAILTMIWVPLTLLFHRRAPGVGATNAATTDTHRTGVDTTQSHFGGLHRESSGNLLIWIMWLVGAAIATHHWPNRSVVGHGRQATILLAIVALSLTELALMTLVKVLALMEYSAVGASRGGLGHHGAGGVGRHEKVTTNANTAAV